MSDSIVGHQIPKPKLNKDAHIGLVGEIVEAIEPETEADPVAILIAFLTYFGSIIGRRSYYLVESCKHFPLLFSVLVGESSKARKGTALRTIESLFIAADPTFKDCIRNGVSSSEGLIAQVQDNPLPGIPIKNIDVLTGLGDKRLLVKEEEFVSVLKQSKRDGNNLSPLLRSAWDSESVLRIMTKNNPQIATDAHIGLVGNITIYELEKSFKQNEMENGFGNRILWCYAERSKLLPDGGNISEKTIKDFSDRISNIIKSQLLSKRLYRSEDASSYWRNIYPELSVGKPGLLGTLTSRAEAQTTRLGLIYALLDGSDTIERKHLEAAKAVWDYCFDSARFIFQNFQEYTATDRLADFITSSPDGVNRTQIRNFFGNNRHGSEIEKMLSEIAEAGKASPTFIKNQKGGPGTELWITTARPTTNHRGKP